MLKRRRRIQKYINALKLKRRGIKQEDVEQLKLQESGREEDKTRVNKVQNKGVSIPKLNFNNEMNSLETDDMPLWQDDNTQLNLPSRNMFRKLQLEEDATQKQYEDRLRKFYNSKYGLHNWATEGQGQHQQDLNDLLNHQEIYAQNTHKRDPITVQFVARTTEHHSSIVTGLDWKGQIVASCGYDQKLKLWSLKSDESNPQLRLKLEKDVYTEGFSLSNCFFRDQQIILGSLRQNYLSIDCQKWKVNKVSSSFLNIHPTFQNIRQNVRKDNLLLYSDNKISILDHHNIFSGSLISGQPLEDVQFSGEHKVLGISKDFLYEWDLRTWRLVNNYRFFNAFTKLWAQDDIVAIGNKLGVLSLSTNGQQIKQYAEVAALVTHVTQIKGNHNGNLLVQCSKWKANAVRIIDAQKGRIVTGWPSVNTKIGLPTVAGFSSSNQLAIANTHGYINFFGLTNTSK